jgi:hypothetical protein
VPLALRIGTGTEQTYRSQRHRRGFRSCLTQSSSCRITAAIDLAPGGSRATRRERWWLPPCSTSVRIADNLDRAAQACHKRVEVHIIKFDFLDRRANSPTETIQASASVPDVPCYNFSTVVSEKRPVTSFLRSRSDSDHGLPCTRQKTTYERIVTSAALSRPAGVTVDAEGIPPAASLQKGRHQVVTSTHARTIVLKQSPLRRRALTPLVICYLQTHAELKG